MDSGLQPMNFGDIRLAFDRRQSELRTACTPAAKATETTALEAVFARCVFAQPPGEESIRLPSRKAGSMPRQRILYRRSTDDFPERLKRFQEGSGLS